jgi:hypothetical protein
MANLKPRVFWPNYSEQGEARIQPLLEAALAQQRNGPTVPKAPAPAVIAVPDALAEFVIEAAKAADYDHLLHADGGAHE